MSEAEAWVMIPKLDKDKTGCVLDMRPLVLCKDCKHGNPCNDGEIDCERDIGTIKTTVHKPDWFCADGEHK